MKFGVFLFSFTIMTRIFLILLCFLFIQNSFSQQFYIRGRVTDGETQLPLKGASVYINNTTKGSITDNNGDFELGPFEPGRYEVVASYVGYDPVLYQAQIKNLGIRIFFKLEKSNLRMLLLEFFNNRGTFICASIIDHNKFVILIGLTKHGLHTFSYITFMIEACTNDRNFWQCVLQNCFRKVSL